jgi:hypothetical protein
VIAETHTGVQGDEVREAGAAPNGVATEAADRPIQTLTGDPRLSSGDITYDDIAAVAYELWVRRGHAHGGDFDDWLEAERALRERRGR